VRKSADGGVELIPRVFRMSAFLPTNIPIVCGIIMSPPTMKYTAFWQWFNQSYMAGLNYQNKNESCTYTNEDLMKGYFAGVGSALVVALALRKGTAGLTKTATGSKLLLLNGMIGAFGASTASYFNTSCVR